MATTEELLQQLSGRLERIEQFLLRPWSLARETMKDGSASVTLTARQRDMLFQTPTFENGAIINVILRSSIRAIRYRFHLDGIQWEFDLDEYIGGSISAPAFPGTGSGSYAGAPYPNIMIWAPGQEAGFEYLRWFAIEAENYHAATSATLTFQVIRRIYKHYTEEAGL